MYVCMYVYIYTYVCMCYMYVCMYVYICTYVCMYIYVRMYVRMYVCIYMHTTESELRGERDEGDDVTQQGLHFVGYINARRHWRFNLRGFSSTLNPKP